MHSRRLLLFSVVTAIGLCPLFAASPNATITYTISGTLAPNLNAGPDCLGLNNQAATATATVSSTLTPRSSSTNSATYTLPVGAITASAGGLSFSNTSPWNMTYRLTTKGDSLTLSGPGPLGSMVTANSALVLGSFPKTTVGPTGHPAPLGKMHSPQNLTSPGSYLSYSDSAISCTLTKLGFTGTASSIPAAPTSGK